MHYISSFQYPYECKTRNLSRPSELNQAIEGQRREGRRGYDEMPGPGLLFPGTGSPFPFPLPVMPSADPAEPRLPLLPPSANLNPLDTMTRLTLMKMMGGSPAMSMSSLLPPPFPRPLDTRTSSSSDDHPTSSPSPFKPSAESRDHANGSKDEDDDDDKKKLMVCVEINSVKYQGILFAQPPPQPKVSWNINIESRLSPSFVIDGPLHRGTTLSPGP